jgi:hypothetical protein
VYGDCAVTYTKKLPSSLVLDLAAVSSCTGKLIG